MNIVLDRPVLVLNRLWQPIHTCSVRRALKLVCLGHAQVVQTDGEARYQTHDFTSWVEHSSDNVADELVRTVRLALRIPKIIVLALYGRLPRKEVKFTRHNVFLRDKFTCQYCGVRFIERELNLDHVVPRDKGGKTTWENIVTSCIGCNTRKANKLIHQVNMRLLREPRIPRWRPLFGMKSEAPTDESWVQFLQPDRDTVRLSA
ncbi:MAG: HNH endonuclease [Akkermansiaceae bacterium]|nr:HNH endonuclease [Akkermansiaceae bacterium]NNM29137.1 HNH endonuclease [Akkermansiaceae bacterium]